MIDVMKESTLKEAHLIGSEVPIFDKQLYKKIKYNFDCLAKPIDGLGNFEWILSRIGAIQNDALVDVDNASLIVFISDNGIIEEGVSQSSSDVTYEVAKALGKGKSTVCHMAKQCGINVVPINVGIKEQGKISGVINRCVASGTNNFMEAKAMSEEELLNAILAGYSEAVNLANQGKKVLLLGEMGIGNTTTSAAVVAILKKLSGEDVTSRGAGLSDEGLSRKVAVVNQAISQYSYLEIKDEFERTLEILRSVGGFDIAALVGAIFGAVKNNMAVISDGFVTGTAALIAKRLNSNIKDYIIFSHNGREQGMKYIYDEFSVRPVISADMALGEGTGACIFYSALKTAHSVYRGGTVFSDINIDSYERLS